jgi:DNA (cytosine-5)-methyltransferase 1
VTLTVTDMFCGAGGSSIGVTATGASVRLALNHWPVAIDTHAANFPGIDHACVNVSTSDPAYFPSTDILIASPECKAHTYSRGRRRAAQQVPLFDLSERERRKREAEARSRATMFDVPRWTEQHRYQAVLVENVLEIFDWELIDEWLAMMAKLGYRHQICSFNSMFFAGSQDVPRPPQSRDRVYIVFTRTGNPKPDLDFRPRAWCPGCDADFDAVQVFKRPDRPRLLGRYRQQYLYRHPACAPEALPYVAPAIQAIDWSLPCPPIGERRRPLKESTIARVRAYFERHGLDPALVQVTHTSRAGRPEVQIPRSVAEPMRTQTGQPETALAWPFVDTARRNATGRRVDQPLTSVSAEGNHHFLVFPERGYVVANFNPGWVRDADRLPLGAVTARDHHGLLVQVAGNTFQRPGSTCRIRSTGEPMRTQTGTLQEALLVPSGGTWRQDAQSVQLPMPARTGTESDGLVRLPPDFLVPYNRTGLGRSVAQPAGTLTGSDRYALASPAAVDAKTLDEFIRACGYRMLTPAEIGAAMAFPGGYKVAGNRDQQVCQYGNAVTPPVMSWVFQRVVETLA